MLEKYSAATMIPVRDLNAARRFYGQVLGIPEKAANGNDVVEYHSGSSDFAIYRSDFAGTNQGTAMSWIVPDGIDGIVSDLRGKGVQFEHYNMPGLTLNGDIHTDGREKMAWFKDPDGNILCVATH